MTADEFKDRIPLAELDEIYGFVPLELRDCKHPNLASLPADLTSDVARSRRTSARSG